MLLNPFEIKAEILNIIEDCKDEDDINVLNQRVAHIDAQSDKQTIEKILFKELLHATTGNERIIRFLLKRYVPKDRLVSQLWTILRNSMTSSEVKIIVLSYLREIETDWKYEDFTDVVGDDIIDNDTKILLDNAIVNPEVQIDFLDFLSSVNAQDRLLLVNSLSDDYSEDALANILIPVFLSAPESEIGKAALESLGKSRSQLAYHALNTAYYYVSDSLKPIVKKNLNLLKLSGIREDSSLEFYKKILSGSRPYRCCATYPDGCGNQALIFSRKNIQTKKVQFVAVVINDYTGIRDCFGFNEISEFECDKIIERFYKDEKNIPIKPEVLQTLFLHGEEISKENTSNWLLPYEYVCWKNILTDITPETDNIEEFLADKLKPVPVNPDDIIKLSSEDFMEHWFLDPHYSSEFEAFIEIADTEVLTPNYNFDKLIDEYLNKVFYKEEYEIWKKRLKLCAYLELNNDEKLAQRIYSITFEPKCYDEFLKMILRKSIYEYYFSLKYNTEDNQNKFTIKQLDDIIQSIEKRWVDKDV
jgi:hypothetical protein